jgi:hypothetical protein
MAVPMIAPAALALILGGIVLLAAGALWPGRWPWARLAVRLAGVGAVVAATIVTFAVRAPVLAQAPLAPVPERVAFAPSTASPVLTIRVEGGGTMASAVLSPAYFSLPAHARVRLVVVSYDPRPSPPPAPYTHVAGTVGDVETVDGRTLAALGPDEVAHTITAPALGLNVPVPVARDGRPATVVATFVTPAAGTYEWLCMCPCGVEGGGWGYPMFQAGMMRGEIRVG